MNWLDKLERKIGRFAIPRLMTWLAGAYVIGYVLYLLDAYVFKNSIGILYWLTLSPYHIMHGQVWRLVSWIFVPTQSNVIYLVIMVILYYQLGTALERTWGTFRFNVYIIGGMIFTIIGAFILYGIYCAMDIGALSPLLKQVISTSVASGFSTYYINLSIFLAFAVMYPDMRVMLYFIIPIKMKWMALVYAALVVFSFITTGWAGRVAIIMSLLNFIIFFLATRNLRRYTPHEIHRRQQFHAQMKQPRPGSGIAKHKCAICGRTELDDPNLVFRFCSRCEGNYEYCQEHLFNHQHVKKS